MFGLFSLSLLHLGLVRQSVLDSPYRQCMKTYQVFYKMKKNNHKILDIRMNYIGSCVMQCFFLVRDGIVGACLLLSSSEATL